MSRSSYRVLAFALVGVLVLLGLAQLATGKQASSKGGTVAAADTSGATTTAAPAASGSTSPGTTSPGSGSTAVSDTAVSTTAPAGPTTTSFNADVITDADCPTTPHGAVLDRAHQRAALCADGKVTDRFLVTTAKAQPLPGSYKVYAKDMNATSNFGGHFSRMTHFVAFTRGRFSNARIAFHSIPVLNTGELVQTVASLGSIAEWGNTSGCIHVSDDEAKVIWNWLQIGDRVHVIS